MEKILEIRIVLPYYEETYILNEFPIFKGFDNELRKEKVVNIYCGGEDSMFYFIVFDSGKKMMIRKTAPGLQVIFRDKEK